MVRINPTSRLSGFRLSPIKLVSLISLLVSLVSVSIHELAAQTPELFVSSRNSNSVKRYNGETGAFIDTFVSPGAGGLSSTQEVMFGFDGNLLVTGRQNAFILRFDGETGAFLGNFSSGYELDEPTKMTLGPDSLIYVSQWGQSKSKVARFDGETGAFVDEFTSIGMNQGCGHVWDADGNLYVASFGSQDVRKFDMQGNFQTVFTNRSGGFTNLWFDRGDLFVVDWNIGSVLRFDGETGNFISTLISGMQNTEGFVFGADSSLYLCDWTRNQVNHYDRDGNFIELFASGGGLLAPNSVAFRPADTATSVEGLDESQPDGFDLGQNYPNPFNPNTTISYSLARASQVTIQIFNLLGKEVSILLDEDQPAGNHHVVWNGTDSSRNVAPSGIYFYKIRAGSFSEIRKMTMIK
jgi:hypothetical protein